MRASAFPNSGLHVGMCVVRARVRFPSPTTPPKIAVSFMDMDMDKGQDKCMYTLNFLLIRQHQPAHV